MGEIKAEGEAVPISASKLSPQLQGLEIQSSLGKVLSADAWGPGAFFSLTRFKTLIFSRSAVRTRR